MSVSFVAIKPGAKLSDQVAHALEAEIRSGRIATGDKLPTEAALVQQFNVSRTVVREAMSRLRSQGLVDARQGSGVYVQQPPTSESLRFEPLHSDSMEAVIQIVEVRRALEAEVADLAAQRHTPAQMLAIHNAVRAIEAAVQRGEDGVAEDVLFHRAIALAANNSYLLHTLDYLAQFLHGVTRVTRANEARRQDFATAVTFEHSETVAAIAARNRQAARAAATAHMDNAIQRMRDAGDAFWQHDGQRLARNLLDLGPVPGEPRK
jgi:GntR family transcriptional repressor for pyruvate dehydrogenase complex